MLNCTNYNIKGGLTINLLFDFSIDEAKFYAWNRAMQKAEVLSSKGETILDHIKSLTPNNVYRDKSNIMTK